MVKEWIHIEQIGGDSLEIGGHHTYSFARLESKTYFTGSSPLVTTLRQELLKSGDTIPIYLLYWKVKSIIYECQELRG